MQHAEDAGHRGAQLVAHVGEELALGPGGRLGRLLCQPQRDVRLLLDPQRLGRLLLLFQRLGRRFLLFQRLQGRRLFPSKRLCPLLLDPKRCLCFPSLGDVDQGDVPLLTGSHRLDLHEEPGLRPGRQFDLAARLAGARKDPRQ